MKNSTNTKYWHSNHGVVIMKKFIGVKTIAATESKSGESRCQQDQNGSAGPKQKL